jgi:tetratricopeptide (TPR) repeat protein
MSHFYKGSNILLIMCLVLLPFYEVSAMQSRRKGAVSHDQITIRHHSRLDSLLELSRQAHNAKTSVEYAEQAVELADSLKLIILKAKALYQSGIALKTFGDFVRSADRLSESEEIYRTKGMMLERHRVLRSLGETYRAGIGYERALAALEEALAWFRQSGGKEDVAKTYNRLAATMLEVFWSHVDYKMLDSGQYISHQEYMDGMAQKETLMQIYLKTLDYLDSATYYADMLKNEVLYISNKNIEIALMTITYDLEDALQEYAVFIERIKRGSHREELPLVLINKARMMGRYRINRPERAIELAQEALTMAIKEELHVYQFLANEVLHDNYYALGNYQKAYEHLIAIRELHEHFQGEQMRLNAATHEYEYQLRLREHELQSRKNLTTLVLGSGVLLAMIFLLFIWVLYRKNQRLSALFRMVREQNQVISEQNRDLSTLNGEKDRLFHIIAHDLRSPFNTISSFSDIIHDEGESLTPEDLRQYTGLIHYTAERTL